MILYKCDGHTFSGGRKCANEIKHDEPSFWLTISGSIKNGLHDSHVIEANGTMHFCSKNCLLAYLFKDNPIGEKKFYNELGEWAKVAFPDAGPVEHLKKLIAEANEAIQAPDDIEEYADCLMCLFAAALKPEFQLMIWLLRCIKNSLKCRKGSGKNYQTELISILTTLPQRTKNNV
jgi:hypothetical protein